MRDGWEMKDAGLRTSRAGNRAGHYNKCAPFTVKQLCSIFMVQTCQRSLRERFLSSVRGTVIKSGL